MSDGNRESIGFIKEVTWNTNPGGNKQLFNFTSMSLVPNNETTASAIVKSNTNPSQPARTKKAASGSLGFELQSGGSDAFMEAVLRSTFGTLVNISATDISFDTTDDSINSVAGAFTDIVAGQWIKTGSTSTTNDGFHRVDTKTSANKLLLGDNVTTENAATVGTGTVVGTPLVNSTTKQSFTIERNFEDITQFEIYTGVRVSEFSLSLGTSAIAGGSISLTGVPGTPSGASGFSGSTAAVTTASMNTVADIKGLFIDGVLMTEDVTQFDITVTTNSADLDALGSDTATEISQGSIGVTGTLNLFKEDNVFALKADGFTTVNLAVALEDSTGKGYIIDVPSVKLSGGAENSGINSQIQDSFTFEAFEDATNINTISISRFV